MGRKERKVVKNPAKAMWPVEGMRIVLAILLGVCLCGYSYALGTQPFFSFLFVHCRAWH